MTGMASVRGVHLFLDSVLIANLTTTEQAPEDSYVIDGVSYDVTTFSGPYLQNNGTEGWDVQVVRGLPAAAG